MNAIPDYDMNQLYDLPEEPQPVPDQEPSFDTKKLYGSKFFFNIIFDNIFALRSSTPVRRDTGKRSFNVKWINKIFILFNFV